jgi:hypothetical protein
MHPLVGRILLDRGIKSSQIISVRQFLDKGLRMLSWKDGTV